ncbi:hypothetical protein [Streptomyces leeuwenhoekii]|uniref:Uncharacterized protein n=1 Tax=Streptomyces leeuwenhoekii TaxID=1437453 RepID=A0A0F7VMS3_STRLW|nr:hypothetical protein [Streptomyces leeuwenhoekii]CQR59398.1 hypothetical protein [Streptomyces leeuwenhoekii]
MPVWLYVVSALTLAFTVLAIPATLAYLAHGWTGPDHGPACRWCHPRLLPRKRR